MPCRKQLGDRIESALALLGITSNRVTSWYGKPCKCKERIQRLNQLESWAIRVLKGTAEKAEEYLENIINQ